MFAPDFGSRRSGAGRRTTSWRTHRLRPLAGVLAMALSWAGSATAETVWVMPTPYPADNFHTVNIQAFAADIATATIGALKLDIRPGGTLAKPAEIKARVREGSVPIGEVLISIHARESPIYATDSVPFLATSFEEAEKLYAAQRPLLEKRLAEEGLVLLYSVPWPPQGIYAKREIRSIEDLKGLRFRTYSPGTQRIAELVGANPIQIEVPELAAAF
jgi:TRAP-type C4-dicarboxylate transport system substrate-binding protein